MKEGRKEGVGTFVLSGRFLCLRHGNISTVLADGCIIRILSNGPELRQELEPGPSGVHIQLQPRGSEVPWGRVAVPSGESLRRACTSLRRRRRRNCGQRRCSLGHVCHAMLADLRGS